MLKRHRRVLIGDVIWWGFLSLLVTSLAIGAWLTPQEWHTVGIVLMIGVPAGFWAITITIIWKRCSSTPDLLLVDNTNRESYSVGCWSEIKEDPRLPNILPKAFTIFITFFEGPQLQEVSRTAVIRALDQVAIEIKTEPIQSWSVWSWKKPKAGLQKGKSIIFCWDSERSLSNTAFVHELLHLIDELVRGKVDYKHEDIVWWEQEGQINQKLRDASL